MYLHSSGLYSQNSICPPQGAPCAVLNEQFHAFANTPQHLGPCGSHGSWNLPGQASAVLLGAISDAREGFMRPNDSPAMGITGHLSFLVEPL